MGVEAQESKTPPEMLARTQNQVISVVTADDVARALSEIAQPLAGATRDLEDGLSPAELPCEGVPGVEHREGFPGNEDPRSLRVLCIVQLKTQR